MYGRRRYGGYDVAAGRPGVCQMTSSGVVLVGGEARRANGMEKYFFVLEGRTFIERLIDALSGIVDEVILVAKDPRQCERFSHLEGVRCVTDIRRGMGPLGGLHAGALAARGDVLFVCACDMPCINRQLVSHLLSLLDDYEGVIPAWKPDMIEPLHAVYRRDALLRYLESHQSLSLRDMVQALRCRFVDIHSLEEIDPGLRSFTNINKLEDLGRLS